MKQWHADLWPFAASLPLTLPADDDEGISRAERIRCLIIFSPSVGPFTWPICHDPTTNLNNIVTSTISPWPELQVVSSWVRDQCTKAKSRLFKLRARQNVRVTDRHQQQVYKAATLQLGDCHYSLFSPRHQSKSGGMSDVVVIQKFFSHFLARTCLFNGPAGWPPVVSLVPSVLPVDIQHVVELK